MQQPRTRYEIALFDSARWDAVTLRDGDIVISAPSKAGTTWTQTIVALLVLQTPELPAPLDQLSIWPDMILRDRADMAAALEAQQHRRFIKTHTPLDGIPYDERVTYIIVGRDPRDIGISHANHQANYNLAALQAHADRLNLPKPTASLRERFWHWADLPPTDLGLVTTMQLLRTAWDMRDRPNVIFLHYQQLLDDLEGTMRGLADRLGITVPDSRWPDLVKAATFDQMRGRLELVPAAAVFQDPYRFFNNGTSGQWREVFDDADERRYLDRVRELASADLLDWVHQGQPH